ncbi:hypothetical protein [Cohnella faecalis]|uniref:hypothetical protein n=1 Tax=Cohnella faecalis TaxID=2315694 RepID=UPI0018F30FD0|nr:hypothetical protein [Cohnella faecalis]
MNKPMKMSGKAAEAPREAPNTAHFHRLVHGAGNFLRDAGRRGNAGSEGRTRLLYPWAQGWAEYYKVYAALLIMAVLFSTIITVLFKVRDRVLIWQKGLIKW